MNQVIKKRLNLVSLILFNVFVAIFGLTTIISTFSNDWGMVFDTIFGAATTEIISVSEEEEDTIYFKTWYNNVTDVLNGNEAVSAAAMAEGSVLLKNNNNALPLASGDKVSLFGVTAYEPIYSMNGGASKTAVSPDRQQFFQNTMEEVGLVVNTELADWYNNNSKQYFHEKQYNNDGVTLKNNGWVVTLKDAPWAAVNSSGKVPASNGGTAIFVFGRSGNEGSDIPPYGGTPAGATKEEEYLSLTANERSVLAGLKEAKAAGKFENIVVIINSTNVMQEHWRREFNEYNVDAALWIATPGSGGLRGVASLLVGTSVPSGKLTDMWYSAGPNNPSSANFIATSSTGNSHPYVLYQEGVYMGYRYAETRYEDYVLDASNAGTYDYDDQVAYPFGYGNSYTDFEYSNLTVAEPSKQDGEYKISVTVKNNGTKYTAKESVQIYLQKPYTSYDILNKIEKPSVELVGFGKTGRLAPGASETIVITVDANRYFADFQSYGKAIGDGTYILEAGNYYLTAAKDSHDAANNFLAKKNITPTNTGGKMDAAGNAALVYQIVITSATQNNYKYKTNTGNDVKELFAHADPNRVDPSAPPVTFMTRNNWNATALTTRTLVATSALRRADAAYDKNQMVTRDESVEYPEYSKVTNGEYIPLIDMRIDENGDKLPYNDERWEAFLDQLSWEECVYLVSYGWRETRAIQSVTKPAFTAPNGPIGFNRIYNQISSGDHAQFPGFAGRTNDPEANQPTIGYAHPSIVAGTLNTDLMYAIGQAYGEDALWAGFAGIFGFGLNMHRSPYGGRNGEYFSDDAFLTGIASGYMSKGIQSKGCHVYNKHFVLNDIEQNRTNPYETWITEQTFRQHYLRPYEIAIQIGDATNVMLAFSRIGSRVSCADTLLLTDYLRGECGMSGYATTDGGYTQSYGHGMVQGVLSGCDLPDGNLQKASYNSDGTITIGGPTINASTGKEEKGNEFYGMGPNDGGYGHVAQGLRESVHRIMYVTVHSNAMNYFASGTKILVHPATWQGGVAAFVITVNVLFGISTAFFVTMLGIGVWDKLKLIAK